MLTREELREVRRIEIVTSRLVNRQLAGSYHSVFKGRGMSFDEVRLYQPGDEVRFIDWNVSARTNDVYVKRFVEERELTVLVIADMSGSLDFGTRRETKRKVAARLAAALAFSAIKNNDRAGLVLLTDRIERFVPPKKGRRHVLRVISEILSFAPQHAGTDLAAGLEFALHVARHRAVVVLISDFLDELGGRFSKALRVAARRHDLIPIVVDDPLEQALPSMGSAAFEDPETGDLVVAPTLVPGFRRAYRRERLARRAQLAELFARAGLTHIEVRTGQPILDPLVRYFRVRARRMR